MVLEGVSVFFCGIGFLRRFQMAGELFTHPAHNPHQSICPDDILRQNFAHIHVNKILANTYASKTA